MGIFSKKDTPSVDVHDLKRRVETLEHELGLALTNLNSLRGLINRKLNGPVCDSREETKDLNKTVLLPDNGSPFNHK